MKFIKSLLPLAASILSSCGGLNFKSMNLLSVKLLDSNENSLTYSYEVRPRSASFDIDVSLSWVSSSYNADINNYLSASIDCANETFTVTKLNDFDHQAKLTLYSKSNDEVRTNVTIDLMQKDLGFNKYGRGGSSGELGVIYKENNDWEGPHLDFSSALDAIWTGFMDVSSVYTIPFIPEGNYYRDLYDWVNEPNWYSGTPIFNTVDSSLYPYIEIHNGSLNSKYSPSDSLNEDPDDIANDLWNSNGALAYLAADIDNTGEYTDPYLDSDYAFDHDEVSRRLIADLHNGSTNWCASVLSAIDLAHQASSHAQNYLNLWLPILCSFNISNSFTVTNESTCSGIAWWGCKIFVDDFYTVQNLSSNIPGVVF